MQQKMQALAERNKRDGPKFIEMYKGLDGVQELPSGLLYKVVKSGSGPSPKATDQVKTHYRGRLVDKTEFDSSYERGQPAVFPVNGVIAGWTEALQKMKVGDKWQLVIGHSTKEPPAGLLVVRTRTLDIVRMEAIAEI